MGKGIVYFIVVCSYILLSKSFGPGNSSLPYLRRSKDIEKIIPRLPAEAILIETLTKGFLIKTHYQRYKIIFGHQPPVETLVRSRRSFAEYSEKFKGLSLFRKDKDDMAAETLPMPPGTLFIDNRQFGRWITKDKQRHWVFYRPYQHLIRDLNWEDFLVTRTFFRKTQDFKRRGLPLVDSMEKKELIQDQQSVKLSFNRLLKDYLKTNY
jgi:hypothetical protein